MRHYTLCSLALSTVALLVGCSGSGTTSPPAGDPVCTRLRDIAMRCQPTRTACQLQLNYNSCVADEPVYRPEWAAANLSCYPETVGCDASSTTAAFNCLYSAADKIPVSSALTMLANDLCQRCPSYAGDGVSDMTTCVMNTTTDQTPTAQTLRFFTDDTLNKLGTCLRNSSPPADGCIAYKSCYMNVFPAVSNACPDGGA
jgi:hypothetical protein